MRTSLWVLASALVFLLATAVQAADAKSAPLPETVSYHHDIRPIFQAQCQGCHQPAKPQGKYVMVEYSTLLAKGESGEAGVVPGQPEKSALLTQIKAKPGEKPLMPKEREPLSERQVQLVAKWIAQGAKDDTPPSKDPKIDQDHPPVYKLPPILTSLDWSPDSKLLAVSGYHEVLLYDGEKLADANVPAEPAARLVGLSERIESVRFSPDGKLLAVAGGSPGRFGEIQVWDMETKKLSLSVTTTFDSVYGATWSHDNTRIAYGCGDNTLRVIDAKSGKQVLFQGAHSDWVLATVWSKDSSHLVSVSRDRSMKLTEFATQRFVDNITSITPGALKGGLITVDRNPMNDELLIGGADGTPKIYQMHRTKARQIGDDFNLIRAFEMLPGRIFAARYSRDGALAAIGTSNQTQGEARIYQTADAKLVSKLEGQQGGVFTVAFAGDGKLVASGGFDGKIRINDTATGKLVREFIPVPLAPEVAAK